MSYEKSFDTRSCAMQAMTFSGSQLTGVKTDTSVRVYRNSPETAIVQLRHFSGKRQTILSVSLDRDELLELGCMINAAIESLRGAS